MHQHNVFIDNDRIVAFDFNDASYRYFSSDNAVIIYCAAGYPVNIPSFNENQLERLERHHFDVKTACPPSRLHRLYRKKDQHHSS